MHPTRPAVRLSFAIALLTITAAAQTNVAQQNLARRPYMGWSSWSSLRGTPTEDKVKGQVEALLAAKLPDLGYRYVNLDDGWSDGWDSDGLPKVNATAFPNGMDGLGKYLHERGLLFGIYLNPGIQEKLYQANPLIKGTTSHIQDIADVTQAGSTRLHAYRIDFSKPAAVSYLNSLIDRLVAWKVDFVKLDFVGPGGGREPSDNREELRQWHHALARIDRPIWLELSNFLSIDQASLWRETANGWRIENDVECYACGRSTDPAIKGNLTSWDRVAARFADVVPWISYASPGGWNDLDSLELGNGDKDGITPAERQSMFILWAISCAPLYLGSDLTHLDPADLALISNRELIAIDQAGVPARPLDIQSFRTGGKQAWLTQYQDGSAVLALFNLGTNDADLSLSWREVDSLRDTHYAAGAPRVLHDLITGESDTSDRSNLTLHIATPHESSASPPPDKRAESEMTSNDLLSGPSGKTKSDILALNVKIRHVNLLIPQGIWKLRANRRLGDVSL
jgi:alpha-galactosidase